RPRAPDVCASTRHRLAPASSLTPTTPLSKMPATVRIDAGAQRAPESGRRSLAGRNRSRRRRYATCENHSRLIPSRNSCEEKGVLTLDFLSERVGGSGGVVRRGR